MLEWDENKRARNIKEHDLDFIDAVDVLNNVHVVIKSKYPDEERWVAIGIIKDKEVAVVYTMRGLIYRIISIRRARKNEQKQYHALLNG